MINKLEQLAQAALSSGVAKLSDIAKMFKSKSISNIVKELEIGENRQQQEVQSQREHEQKMQEQALKAQEQQKKEPLIDRKLNIEFDNKKILYQLIYEIEENRNTLVYGNSGKEQVNKVLQSFIKFKEIILDLINKGGIKIE